MSTRPMPHPTAQNGDSDRVAEIRQRLEAPAKGLVGTDFRAPVYADFCEQHGWELETFAQLCERLEVDMQREGAAVAEGFCPRCLGRLTTDRHGPWCGRCDVYPHAKFEGDKCVSVGTTTGPFKRSELSAVRRALSGTTEGPS